MKAEAATFRTSKKISNDRNLLKDKKLNKGNMQAALPTKSSKQQNTYFALYVPPTCLGSIIFLNDKKVEAAGVCEETRV